MQETAVQQDRQTFVPNSSAERVLQFPSAERDVHGVGGHVRIQRVLQSGALVRENKLILVPGYILAPIVLRKTFDTYLVTI